MIDESKRSDSLTPQDEPLKKGGEDVSRGVGDDGSASTMKNDDNNNPADNRDQMEKGKEKYLREVANIEGLPDDEEPVKDDSPELRRKK